MLLLELLKIIKLNLKLFLLILKLKLLGIFFFLIRKFLVIIRKLITISLENCENAKSNAKKVIIINNRVMIGFNGIIIAR